jgi:hypothetical protein
MRYPISVLAASLTALAVGAGPAHAGLLGGTADFAESLDVPYYNQNGPLVVAVTGATIDGSTELTSNNVVSNPSNYSDNILNASLGDLTLSLSAPVFQDWQTITFTVSNITPVDNEVITGFIQTSAGAIATSGFSPSDPFTTTTSFTANSLTVSYSVNDIADGNEFYFASSSAPDTFAITVEPVPEPASIALLSAGLVSIAALRRRA